MSILKDVPTVAHMIRRHDVFTRHGREWMAAQEARLAGPSDVAVPTVDGGVVYLPRLEPITVRRSVPERPCATA
ncbi:hypothetical protein [Streptomyces sp. NRRL S-378]|uniref:hypothetical protein n=1 Tax=Streptomyces sp. NRRL S-378 TaxID=1463904 RepID=UPI000B15949C|nr:hypothetical protein [Streptomyces sp. NRRL S-378]